MIVASGDVIVIIAQSLPPVNHHYQLVSAINLLYAA